MVARGVEHVDMDVVRNYARDMRNLLEDSEFTEQKAFLRSFVKKIIIDKEEGTIQYKLPLPPKGKFEDRVPVLPIDNYGGEGGTRTPTGCPT